MSDTSFKNQRNTVNLDPNDLKVLWKSAYSTHISQDINVCVGNDVSRVDHNNFSDRAGACLQNALRVMKRMIEAGIPENDLRAVYIINYSKKKGVRELCMTNGQVPSKLE